MANKRPGVGKATNPVGYGTKGNAFHSVTAFNASKAGQAKPQSAKNQALASTRRGISQAMEHKGPFPLAGAPQHPAGNAGHTTPMPGHPSQNPTHVHGPSTIGKINGPAPRGAM
jgi:hypothetical protein